MSDNVVWVTYDELAERLGIERESARQQVKRKKWGRRPGNDGKVRVGVPEEVLDAGVAPEEEVDPGHVPAPAPAPDPDHVPAVVGVLTRHIERLELQLEAALNRVADRDAIATERDLVTVQLDALRAALAAAEKDRDRWHEVASRTPEPAPSRPWWRRLVG